MGKKVKYSKELKFEIVKRYLKGESASTLAKEYDLSKSGQSIIRRWVHQYEVNGKNSFETSTINKSYSKEFKIDVCKEYLSGGISLQGLINKHKITSDSIVTRWLKKYNRSIVSYALSNCNNNKLVFDTFDLAIKEYPNAKPIFHSDRGFQYTSKQFKLKLDEAGMIQSMSRVGKCIDNGTYGRFLGNIKIKNVLWNQME